jgi:hypothetical protein
LKSVGHKAHRGIKCQGMFTGRCFRYWPCCSLFLLPFVEPPRNVGFQCFVVLAHDQPAGLLLLNTALQSCVCLAPQFGGSFIEFVLFARMGWAEKRVNRIKVTEKEKAQRYMQRANGLIPLSQRVPLPYQLKLCSYCPGWRNYLRTSLDSKLKAFRNWNVTCRIPGSSANIAQQNAVPGRGNRFFYFLQNPDRLWGPPSFPTNGNWKLLRRGKAAGTWRQSLTSI